MTNIPAVVNPRAPKRMVGCELLNLAAHNPADLVQLSEIADYFRGVAKEPH